MSTISNFIGGEFRGAASGAWLDNVDPSTGQAYSRVADSGAADVEQAVAAAQAAFPAWSHAPAEQRAALLMRLAELIERDIEKLARAECVDNGKPLTRCREQDMPRVVKNFRYFGSALLHERSELHVSDYAALNYTLRRPRGVAGLISPWNLPLYLLTWKIAPAIAMGNTVVAKPSEITPATASMFAALCAEAGLPPGVVNIVHGRGAEAGAALVAHPAVSTISFTGGTATGREIARVAAPLFKKVSLELGGKNPNIVFADAGDPATGGLPAVVDACVQAAFANQGQICLCGSRLLVEQPLVETFLGMFLERAAAQRVGDPLEASTQQGAMVSREQLEKTRRYVQLARDEGGKVLLGGDVASVPGRCRDGYFHQPTVITGLAADCRTNQEEIFGPVVTVLPFRDEADAVAIANSTPYGLSASVWTQNVSRAHRMAENIASGTVWLNCWMMRDLRVPFGGMKQSGVGREGGDEAMRFFTEPKNVCLRTPMQAPH